MKPKHLYWLIFPIFIVIAGYFFVPQALSIYEYRDAMQTSISAFADGKITEGAAHLKRAFQAVRRPDGTVDPAILEQTAQLLAGAAAENPIESRSVLEFIAGNNISVPCEMKEAVLAAHLASAKKAIESGRKDDASKLLALADQWRAGCSIKPESLNQFSALISSLENIGGVPPRPEWVQPAAPAATATTTQSPAAPAPGDLLSKIQNFSPKQFLPSGDMLQKIKQLHADTLAKILALLKRGKPAPEPAPPAPAAAATPTAQFPAPPAAEPHESATAPAQPAQTEKSIAAAQPAPPAPKPKPTAPPPDPLTLLAGAIKKQLLSRNIGATAVSADEKSHTVAIALRSASVGTPELVGELKITFAVVDDTVQSAKWPAETMKIAVSDRGGALATTWWIRLGDYRDYRRNRISGAEFRSKWAQRTDR